MHQRASHVILIHFAGVLELIAGVQHHSVWLGLELSHSLHCSLVRHTYVYVCLSIRQLFIEINGANPHQEALSIFTITTVESRLKAAPDYKPHPDVWNSVPYKLFFYPKGIIHSVRNPFISRTYT